MKQYNITENDANWRLDKFLKKLFPNASISLIYKINRKNKVKVNWKKEDNEYKLKVWDEVKIFLTDEDIKILSIKKEEKKEITSKFDTKNIVYEDKEVLVINKDPFINVHPWDHKTKEISIIEQIHDYLWEKVNSLTFKPSLVHRIDRDTSWILIIAKNKELLTKLVNDFKNHTNIKKIYYAIVVWKLEKKSWIIDKKLLRIENAKNEDKVIIDEKWQKAITKYKVIKENKLLLPEWEVYLNELEIEILTWRMHQIRVHLASLWTPILWDNKYWDRHINSYFSKKYNLHRQALHSWKIEFKNYIKNKNISLTANIKKDLTNILNNI